jgi:hypothetical protein
MNTNHIRKPKVLNIVKSTLMIAAAYLALTSSGKAQNLIQNGSFELPGLTVPSEVRDNISQGIPNWTIAGNNFFAGQVTIHKTPDVGNLVNPTFNFAQDGNYYIDLSGQGTHGIIFQDFATVPFTSYNLSFYIGASSDYPPSANINVKLDGIASLLDTTLTPNAPTTNIDWSLQTFLFTADSATTRLSFLDVGPSGNGNPSNDNNTSYIDNVQVEAVPEPSTYALLAIAALIGLASLRRRRSAGVSVP